jgi:tetratricopeptide (TPR) repeat protein
MSKRAELENIDNTIRYLRNAISLEPLSISANYEMANLQYRIGNLDLAHRHIKRLRKLCLAEMLCLNELGQKKLEHAKELYGKINNLLSID